MAVFGEAVAVRDVDLTIGTRAGEHLGQMIANARMNGVTPRWPEK